MRLKIKSEREKTDSISLFTIYAMNVEILTSVDPAEWNDDVKKLGGCCFHSYEWSMSSSKRSNAKPLYFRWVDESGVVQGGGFGLISGRSLAGIISNKTLSLGSFPACRDTAIFTSAIEKIIKYCSKSSIAVLKMHSFGTPFGTEILQELGFSVSKRWEFLINLDISEDELWKKLHSKKRNLIRKGQKQNLSVKKAEHLEDVMEFRTLALETWQRKTIQGISFPGVAEEDYYKLLKSHLMDTGLGRLYLAYDGKRPIAGSFFVGFNKKAYYMLSSASDQGLKKAAPDLILWTCMNDYQKQGYKVFNLGGVSERDLNGQPLEKSGLYHFKIRFGADVYPCFKGELVLRPKQFKLYSLLKALKSRFAF